MSSAHFSKPEPIRLSQAHVGKLNRVFGGIAGLGVLGSLIASFVDSERFAFSYLVGFVWVITLSLGALFFVLVQHLTKAGWSVVVRRQAEWISTFLPIGAVLFIPIAILSPKLYSHWMGEHAHHDVLIQRKAAFLNAPFFFIRAVIYFACWIVISRYFRKTSEAQDSTGDIKLSEKMQKYSPPSTILFALTISFAGFDWMMSLDPHWFSTIYGVYVFSGAVVSFFALLALTSLKLNQMGALGKWLNVEHLHDIGKFLFAFIVFWAYIAFSQYFLIWYAHIPEETIFYKHRFEGSWKLVSVALLVGHFILPFLVLLSRTAKRTPVTLALGAIIILVMHYIDIYWLVMPNLDHHGAHFSWVDLVTLLAPLGLLGLWFSKCAKESSLIPVSDPYLPETLKVENL